MSNSFITILPFMTDTLDLGGNELIVYAFLYGFSQEGKLDHLLPTPTASEGEKWTNIWNPNSQMGQSLSAMAGSGMLPTPRTSGHEKYDTLDKRKGHKVAMSCLDSVVDYVTQKCADKDGETFRLSPLFTEEMMGFPLMWTTSPFLRTNGETSQSKPTATPSSPK